MSQLHAFFRDQRGNTLIEYGLIVTCIAIAILGAAGALGTQLGSFFTTTAGSLR